MCSSKSTPTTFGKFIEWYIGWRYGNSREMQADDVTPQMLKEFLSCYVDGTFDDESRKFDRFFGVNGRVFGGSYYLVARYIRDHFNTPITLNQYSDCFTLWAKFTIGRTEFDMCMGNYFGEYEYDNIDGFPI